jgi:hypothetical protein
MRFFPQSGSYSRRSAGVLLLVGVLAGITVGGGVGVIAASSTKTVTVCASKKTNVLRYAKNNKCTKTETKVVLNQSGDIGPAGVAGVAGAKGDTGAAGVKGDTGAAGASSPTGFTARSVCGANGTTLCAVGVRGPGGGTIFYVDTTNEIPGYDYLEAAPTDGVFVGSATGVWATDIHRCSTSSSQDCQTSYLSDAGSMNNYLQLGTGRAATALIIARHDGGFFPAARTSYAAGVADSYSNTVGGIVVADWWLPSRDELNELCKYARNTLQTVGSAVTCAGGTLRSDFSAEYHSSSEEDFGRVWSQDFGDGSQNSIIKSSEHYVRPVRGF